MKKDPPTNDKKILRFILEQQLPEARVAGSAKLGPIDDAIAVAAVDHVTQVALETCRCVHLQEHLPHLLDLELCKAVHHPRGWVVANPVHSMHLQTQLEDSVPALAHNKQPPVLYGEEQQRTMALNTEGIVEHWCPLDGYSAVIHDDTAMEKMEHMPTLQNIHRPVPVLPSNKQQPHLSALQSSHSLSMSMSPPGHAASHPSRIPSMSSMPAPSESSSSTNISGTSATSTAAAGAMASSSSMGPHTKPAPETAKSSEPVTDEVKPDASAKPDMVTSKADSKKTDKAPSTEASVKPVEVDPPTSTASVENDREPPAATSTNSEQKESSTLTGTEPNGEPPKAEREPPKESFDPAPPPSTETMVTDKMQEETAKPNSDSKPDEKGTDAGGSKDSDMAAKNINHTSAINAEESKEETIVAKKVLTNATAETGVKTELDSSQKIYNLTDKEQAAGSSKEEPKKEQLPAEGPKETEVSKKEGVVSEDEKQARKEDSTADESKDMAMADSSKKDEEAKPNSTSDHKSQEEGAKESNLPPANDASYVDAQKDAKTSDEPNGRAVTELNVVAAKYVEITDNKMDVDQVPSNKDGLKPGTNSMTPAPDASTGAAVPSVTPSGSAPETAAPTNETMSNPTDMIVEDLPLALPKEKFNHLRIEEDRIRLIRRSLSSHRIVPKKKVDPKKRIDPKNKRKREDFYKTPGIPGWHASNLKELSREQEDQWLEAMAASRRKVETWMENFRLCRETFWEERERQTSSPPPGSDGAFYLPTTRVMGLRSCETCSARSDGDRYWEGASKKTRKPRRRYCGDDIMQCLECNFVGCSPQSICRDSKQHILQHLLISGHKFAVSCGERGRLFCFCCGDFVYHEVFEQEKARIDYGKKMALMAWKPHHLYRSFDPFHFMKTQDHGIVWRGLVATYPQLVPYEHVRAAESTNRRQALFKGEVAEKWMANKPSALMFAASQSLQDDSVKHKISKPVGMYNLGNTCYKSAVLQCLIHCQPLQRFFLKENGHHHQACKLYRNREASKRKKKKTITKPDESICLACEMDRLFLSYYGSTIGVDVRGAMEEACNQESSETYINEALEQGDPLVISEMLTSSWKTDGMNSLVGYKQHDSHEFLNSFLEMVGKQTKQHWLRIQSAINVVKSDNTLVEDESEYPQGMRSPGRISQRRI